MSDQPLDSTQSEADEQPPFFKNWSQAYLFVLAFQVVLIALFAAMTYFLNE